MGNTEAHLRCHFWEKISHKAIFFPQVATGEASTWESTTYIRKSLNNTLQRTGTNPSFEEDDKYINNGKEESWGK